MSSRTLVEEYRKCLDRDCDRSVPSTCTDPKLKALLWKSLEADPELHAALHNDCALPTIDRALRVEQDVAVVLARLAQAFEVLELAAVNLCCFPWRKEFHVIKMFSGGYVHNLKSVLFEEDIATLLGKMGYVKREEDHCFKVTHLPSMADLTVTACAFFAARVECEILAQIVSELDTGKVSGGDVIRERRKNAGGVDGCVKKLRRLVSRVESGERKEPELHILQATGPEFFGDIYRDVSEDQRQLLFPESTIGSIDLQLAHRLPMATYQPPFCDTCCDYLGNQHGMPGSHKCKENGKDFSDRPGREESEEVKTTSLKEQGISSIRSPYEHLDGANGSRGLSPKSPTAEIHIDLPMGKTYLLHNCVIDGASLDYQCDDCHVLHDMLCEDLRRCRGVQHHIHYIPRAEKDVILKEVVPQRYRAHTCTPKDGLPHYRCDACQALHYIKCDELADCKNEKHPVQMLYLDSERKLWCQRTKLDRLLSSSFLGSEV